MTAAFDTLAAARELEAAGMDRPRPRPWAGVVRSGQGELATKDDIRNLRWIVGIHFAISLATLAAVLAMAFQP